jgi:deoxycytidylate deaminase
MIDLAVKMAKRSNVRTHKTGAVIVSRHGEIISKGWSHPTERRLRQTPFSIHAELHAILRSPREKLRGATIYVATLTKGGNITNSKPCEACTAIIREVGIAHVVYTVKERA